MVRVSPRLCAYKYKLTTNDKIILWWLTNRKHTKNNFWLDTSLLPWWTKSHVPPKWCSHKWRHTFKKWSKNFLWPLTSFEYSSIIKNQFPVEKLSEMDVLSIRLFSASGCIFFAATALATNAQSRHQNCSTRVHFSVLVLALIFTKKALHYNYRVGVFILKI